MYVIENSGIANLNVGNRVEMVFLGVRFTVDFVYEDGAGLIVLSKEDSVEPGVFHVITEIDISLNKKEAAAYESHVSIHRQSLVGNIDTLIVRKVMSDILAFYQTNLGNYAPCSFQFDDKYYKKSWVDYVKYLIHEIMEGRDVRAVVPEELKEAIDKDSPDDTICPVCGAKLVERKGKYGEFIGCSNYPKCKYTRLM